MRLGQLARKLALKPSEIVEFLSVQQIRIEDNVNTRLENEHVVIILQRFAPDQLVDTVVQDTEVPLILPEQTPVVAAVESIQEEAQVEEPVMVEKFSVVEKSEEEVVVLPDVIKAPKVELSGLKVLGKIDLPEPKKKEVAAELAEGSQPTEEKRQRREFKRNEDNRTGRKDQRPRQNPVALQREREKQEEEKKLQEQREREKQRKTQYYLSRVKMAPPTKPVRIVDEETVEMSAKELAPEPKSWFGKFIKWLSN